MQDAGVAEFVAQSFFGGIHHQSFVDIEHQIRDFCKGQIATYKIPRIIRFTREFPMTASGKIRGGQAGKRHGMIKRTKKQIRNQRGTTILSPGDAGLVRIRMPYAR